MKNREVREYYDNFSNKLIDDFLKPNPRIANAISKTLGLLDHKPNKILDLGFGIGWSTYEFAKHFRKSEVRGYDLSKVLQKIASSLFQLPNLQYTQLDLTEHFPEGKFDAVVLLDVFEHIPTRERSKFYQSIKEALSEKGRIIMTCPSVFHQQYLRQYKPEGLQPVDEDVDIQVLEELSNNTDTVLIEYSLESIWNKHDYFFACLEKKSFYPQLLVTKEKPKIRLLNFYDKVDLINRVSELESFLPSLSYTQKVRQTINRITN